MAESSPKYLRYLAVHPDKDVTSVGVPWGNIEFITYLIEATLLPLPSKGIAKANICLVSSPMSIRYEVLIDIVNFYETFDATAFTGLPLEQQRIAFLNLILDALAAGAPEFGWEQEKLEDCRKQIVAEGFRLHRTWRKPKLSPDRKHRASVFLETEAETRAWLVFTDRQGAELRWVLFSIVASAPGPIEFILGDLTWEDAETVRVLQKNRRDSWLINLAGEVQFVFPRVENGDAQALFQLGCLYEEGRYVLRDVTKGRGLIQQAADKGDKHAIRYLERHNRMVDENT